MKEQGQNTPALTNGEEIGSLPEKEFRIMIVKMIQNLGNRMEKIQETFIKDLEKLKSKQTIKAKQKPKTQNKRNTESKLKRKAKKQKTNTQN